ncbi:hypothetical protein SNE40_002293 [Patella caerulea]|uniref:Large ribosomal subunit protein uL16m n=1 Tax=Patella caerulea TaxID=87958 RepID=A0AAN8JS26_PATCE
MFSRKIHRAFARLTTPFHTSDLCRTDTRFMNYVPVATLMKCDPPPTYDHVEYPEKRRLKFFPKVPDLTSSTRPAKMARRLFDMRGPELVHNKIQYGDFAIQATGGGKLRWGHLEMIRMTLNRKMDDSRMFAIWRISQPWKSVSKKGQGKRMGSGKGPIDHYVFPVKAGRMIVEVGGKCEFKEVYPFMNQIAKILPFKARVVDREFLEKEKEQEKWIEENNINPFNFKDCIRKNYLGCSTWVSPYDFIFNGKHR